jgi:hypothetical protein
MLFAPCAARGAGATLLVAAVLLAACTPRSGGDAASDAEPVLEAEEVTAAVDAAHDPSADPKEERRTTSFLGVLPGDYPEDLPVPEGSSLVDYGDREGGWRYVELHTTVSADAVRSELEEAWRAAGWQQGAEQYEKGPVDARLVIESSSPTLTRVEILWRR